MNAESNRWMIEGEIPPELIFGIHVKLEGGIEDTTIRPTCIPRDVLDQWKQGTGADEIALLSEGIEGEIPPELVFGIHVKLEGGIEDTTIRPTCIPRDVLDQWKQGTGADEIASPPEGQANSSPA